MLDELSREIDFPSLENRVYLNTAAEGILPQSVKQALLDYFEDAEEGMDGRISHEEHLADLRRLAGAMYGMEADQIGVCSCSSEAYNLAAMALGLKEGDEVIINDLDFPAGSTPWMQPDCPAEVKVWRSRDNALQVEDLVPLLSGNTRLVSSSLVSFYNGFMIPLPDVVEAVRKHSSALITLDVTQALGRVPLHLDGVDLVISSTHKWILGTHGGCLVGVPSERAGTWTVPAGGWHNLEQAFEPDRFEKPARSKPGADGFMVGMPNFPAIYAVQEALSYIQGVGVEAIAEAADPLIRGCLKEISTLEVDLITPTQPGSLAGIFSFLHPRSDEIHARLREKNIHVMNHAGRIRVSIHGYNTQQDIVHFLDALKESL